MLHPTYTYTLNTLLRCKFVIEFVPFVSQIGCKLHLPGLISDLPFGVYTFSLLECSSHMENFVLGLNSQLKSQHLV